MSKVNYYLDSKQKARQRQRRYETAHKKFSRARKADRREYGRFYGQSGYGVIRQRENLTFVSVKDPKGRTVLIPKFESIGREVFIVRNCGLNIKPYRKFAARKFRRTKKFDEDSYLLKGSKYKRDYEVVWSVT